MFRLYLLFGLQLFTILIVCSASETTPSKRLQKCLGYSTQTYGQAVPNCESSNDKSGVIGIEQFPYIATLGYRNQIDQSISWRSHGTLVSSRYVLTAAHYLRKSSGIVIKVRLGAASIVYSDDSISSDYDVEEIIVHPLYKSLSNYNDIGLIKLSRKVEISENVRPICLPDSDLQSNTIFQVNYESTMSENPPQRPLTKYEYQTVTNANCNEIYLMFINRKLRNGITDELLCSSKSSNTSPDYICQGESGAPLYIDHPHVLCSHIQLGISSFGVTCEGNFPNVATKVFTFSDWIESVIWAEGEDF